MYRPSNPINDNPPGSLMSNQPERWTKGSSQFGNKLDRFFVQFHVKNEKHLFPQATARWLQFRRPHFSKEEANFEANWPVSSFSSMSSFML